MNALIRFKNLAPLLIIALSLVSATAATTDVIFSFEEDNGEYADTDLETDSAGNIYGSTVLGGDHGSGTVFQLSPTISGWEQTVLYNFTGSVDGGEPYKGVTIDRHGNLYGTAVTGGSGGCEGGCGVVYKLTQSNGTWHQRVIYAFTGADDGAGPGARVTVDRSGNVYGMTPTGGMYGAGTIYKLQPHAASYTFQVIHSFTGGDDGASGSAGRMLLDHGRLYGAVTAGGMFGSGVVFELTPTTVGEWDFRTLYSFHGQPDGSFPYGALLRTDSGKIYGTTYYGGQNGIGAVYELSPRSVGEWNEKVLYSFQTGSDGNSPISNLVSDASGNLYGTTSEGGLGRGTIFKLTAIGGGGWTESVVHSFAGSPDGGFSYNGMVVDAFGNFYGATVHGGTDDDGSVYQFTP
ncbi:MAG TPA: choice-of-anchor tandem repeat GloVer-containing protein [Candidatus Udaeobacter sp.]|jgi:uncharacterized repeat protein (TIGR03803 family)